MSRFRVRRMGWFENFRWAMNAARARRIRYYLGFSERQRFDAALRPPVDGGVIAYPDALYHIGIDDVIRALDKAQERSP